MAQTVAPLFEVDALGVDRASLRRSLANRLVYSMGKDPITATTRDWFHTTAYAVRERLIGRWMETMRRYYRADSKRVYYLSMEFLTGRLLANSLLNLGMYDACRDALGDLELQLDEIREMEPDAGLGNGGLGRLAACFLDSMATLSLPGYGYGIRYEYGMFQQIIEHGRQVEEPDNWLRYGNPWEFPRPEVLFPVKFGGRVVHIHDERGHLRVHWIDTDDVMAMAYDTPVPGYGTDTVNNMRLWSAKASVDFSLTHFNEGNYLKSVESKNASENLSKVLYPSDSTDHGRALRFKQQYFFVAASIQDILRRFQAFHHDFDELPDKVAIQLNDTHPSIAVAELMRVLVDQHDLTWDRAWDITRATFSYTNHTLMPEALEAWPVSLIEELLPRHLQIIYEINQRFLEQVRHRHPGDVDRLRRTSIVDEDGDRRIRMSHLAIVGSHAVNGVSRVHTDLMKSTIFADFDDMFPERIVSITNGITPRRWLHQANPALSELLTECIGPGWIKDLSGLAGLAAFADDPEVRRRFRAVKLLNKERLAALIQARVNLAVDPESLFDVHVKRFHEYKRQLLNVLHVVTRYNRLRDGRAGDAPVRTVIFSGKAAPGYAAAKLVIRLIHAVADVVNNDPATGGRLKVAFIPDYNVTTAAKIVPAGDLSEQISTAGTEASGTGNMKLSVNGALTIGTLDGATIEMSEAIGGEGLVFLFGLRAQEAAAHRAGGYDPWTVYWSEAELRQTLEMIASGYFSADDADLFKPLVEGLTRGGDHYLVLADYADYVRAQERVDEVFRDPDEWARRALLNIAGMGTFSSDRAVLEYATRIWGVSPQHS